MRPPMQKSALQQNEANRLQQHSHQQQQSVHLIPHKHLQQQHQLQQQLPLQTTAITTTTTSSANVLLATNINDVVDQTTITTAADLVTTGGRKSKLEQRELLVENHLNNACFAQVHHNNHHQQQQQTTAVSQLLQQQQKLAPITAARKTTTTATTQPLPPTSGFYNEFYQQQQQQQQTQRQKRPTTLLNRSKNFDDNSSSVKLLDLSTSPPPPIQQATATITTAASNSNHTYNTTSANNKSQQQRFSYTSQYSRSSSSDDSSSLSLSTACGSLGAGGPGFATATSAGGGSGIVAAGIGPRNSYLYNSGSSYSSYNNTFDDAAENFIINFPADTTPTHSLTPTTAPTSATVTHATEFYNYCLPLSETEPLLTNIEATVRDKQRSIYLNKNSASLIFTKKDLSQTTATATPTYQQQFKLQSKTNNNFNGHSSAASLQSPSSSATAAAAATTPIANTVRRVPPPSTGHSTLRSFSEENYRRKPTKHLPATYHQQHRRSLQLNYNNNLVTTSTCGSIANNNHCCSSGAAGVGSIGHNSNTNGKGNTALGFGRRASSAGGGCLISNSNSAVLHKPHHNNQNYQQQKLQQHQQQQQQQPGYNNPCSLTNNTAAATRKQYAYSWYAPVYSALEEELEHDSRDSSPIRNLANTKKQNIHQYHHRTHDLNSSLPTTASDSEREALLETRNNINIQSHLQTVNPQKRESLTKQLNPSKLALQHSRNSSNKGNLHPTAKGISLNGGGSGGDIAAVEGYSNYDLEGPHAGSLGLAGGPQPRRIRFGNFLKSLVGLRPSLAQRNAAGENVATSSDRLEPDRSQDSQIPSSPEITITRTPSEQNMVVMRDPMGRQDYNVVYSSREKLANGHGDRIIQSGGSTSSLNVMQQKLWNIMRREGSAISLHQEKSQSIVHYTGLRKCETVIALTRQASSPCSPTLTASAAAGVGTAPSKSQLRLSHTGSGIFSANGVEQIRPLNRLRNSVSSMNNTCSRCSSLLSLAASSSRFSLNNASNPHPNHQHQHYHQVHQHQHGQYLPQTTHFSQHQRNSSNISSSNISSTFSHSRDGSVEAGLHFAVKRNSRTSSFSTSAATGATLDSQRNSSSTASSCSRTPSLTSPTTTTATTASTTKLITPPTENALMTMQPSSQSTIYNAPSSSPSTSPASPTTGAVREVACFPMETTTLSAPLTVTSHFKMLTMKKETPKLEHHANGIANNRNDNNDDATVAILAGDVIDGVSNTNNSSASSSAACRTTTSLLCASTTNVTPSTSASLVVAGAEASAASAFTPDSIMATILQCNAAASINGISDNTIADRTSSNSITPSYSAIAPPPTRPFEIFTCKLCLIDVEDASNSTVLHQCGCQFCTECMKAYVEFEISEGAYEISCPDAQCPEQGAMILPEIAKLTTNNLMKKHHRYRLNREIELDKTRTWCPRAGCETVCLIGSTINTQSDAAPSTSSSAAAAATVPPTNATTSPSSDGSVGGEPAGNMPLFSAVQCPSCKDEFCSACKKTWHPNITCEEHSRRLAADGQDDIGIPFDNDLIKCCPMCAVPIEKDEGCAQMMCKRCKHVFCWYCLASLDDDFLLRHYDRGPCKNKLGHSRASVVWHRAQVIGIFAGFGILLLVASPLLLLAAPCIICCKCRSCSGSKIDEPDGDMDEATALQSLN